MPAIASTTPSTPGSATPNPTMPDSTKPRSFASEYVSVLHDHEPGAPDTGPPDYFVDLNLDQLVTSVLTGRDEYDLAGIFSTRLLERADVEYRQDVLRDLERPEVAEAVNRFAQTMRTMRVQFERSAKLRYLLQRQLWWLAGAHNYCAAVEGLARGLAAVGPRSAALTAFLRYLEDYRTRPAFTELASDADEVAQAMDSVQYRLQIYGDRVQISRAADDEEDYAADVAATFERFRQSPSTSYRVKLASYPEMNHVEEAIADRVALLFPEPFADLARFCRRHTTFVDQVVARFDREIQFFLAWTEFVDRLAQDGLPICYPTIVADSDPADIRGGYDVALADRLTRERRPLVGNDLRLTATERVVVVTGPNQGGKTTYARMIGQFHHLAALGLSLPAEHTQLPLPDLIGTHFERGENLHDLTGKLDDDLVRIHQLLEGATERSLLILNEIFTSTTADDALWLSVRVLDRIRTIGCRSVCVTFLDELATRGDDTISMVAQIDPDDPSRRTLRLLNRPADGRAYAAAVAARYGLTADELAKRLARREAS